jgi:hypothetical protein
VKGNQQIVCGCALKEQYIIITLSMVAKKIKFSFPNIGVAKHICHKCCHDTQTLK